MTNELDTLRTIAIIAAVAATGAIGFKGQMPPKMVNPEDRAIFARKTAGGVLLCGNTTTAQTILTTSYSNDHRPPPIRVAGRS